MGRFQFQTVPVDSLDAKSRSFLFDGLYRAWGVDPGDDWLHAPHGGVFVVAREEGAVVGLARLMPTDATTHARQLRQVVVSPRLRRCGLGRTLVRALEDMARAEGASDVWLNARDSAFDFYVAQGYHFAGESFLSEMTGIAHRRMRKTLP